MPEVTQLTLAVDSRQVKGATRDLDQFSKAGKGAEREAGAMTKAFSGFGRVIGTVALGLLSREVIQAADAYKNMSARLQLVTSSLSELIVVQQGVFDISQRTRVNLGQTTDLYASLARSTDALGVSQEDLLAVTESINQSLIISGTSASAAQAALTQLGQGFASGVLRGEELNSVLEQAPRLARALADGLGVPIGKLRELGQAGELTADKVFRALQKSGAALNEEFAKMPLTVEQATTQAGNSISRLIGIIDKATGASSAFAIAISGAARGLDTALNRFSEDAIVRAQAEVDTLRQNLLIALQSNSGEHPGVKLLQKQLENAQATLKALKDDLANNQSGAETARLGRFGKTAPSGPDLSTISGLQDRIKALKDLRDNAKVGSEDFKRFTAELAGYENQLKKILPSKSGGSKQKEEKPVFTSYDESITQRAGNLLEDSDITQAKVYADTLKKLDELFFTGGINAELYESALKKLTGATSSADEQASKFIEHQKRLAELLGATESAGIEKQREDMELLTKALQDGLITEQQYLEAVSARLDLVAEKTKSAKTFAEELGLSFSSAFEDAVVGGAKFSDVLKGLADDILRIIVRKQVTEPFANAAGSFDFGSLFSSFFSFDGGGSTGSGARSGGLDGKGGFMAMLHPQETVLDHSKGQGAVTVNVINQSGGNLSVTGQNQRRGADGGLTVDVIVGQLRDALADEVGSGSGSLSRAMESRYGLRTAVS